MEWLSTSTVIERAKEELEILETNHPNGFHYLKSELKIFISSFDSHNFPPPCNTAPLPTTSSALTQESSTSKKRKANRLTSNEDTDETAMPKIRKVPALGFFFLDPEVRETGSSLLKDIKIWHGAVSQLRDA
ncbi:unnamed protein product [Fraxinus pennsylvanica]|uniref:Uncharacterized protein n=1 Tax=Fraxinus pennsylvanica TaxID=56036 RepID=A0AAD1YN84_9LAMI|nr:unnamed protein product [Fraxinus pennsylvanica]